VPLCRGGARGVPRRWTLIANAICQKARWFAHAPGRLPVSSVALAQKEAAHCRPYPRAWRTGDAGPRRSTAYVRSTRSTASLRLILTRSPYLRSGRQPYSAPTPVRNLVHRHYRRRRRATRPNTRTPTSNAYVRGSGTTWNCNESAFNTKLPDRPVP
jgi:hypothetical protein